MKKPLITNIFFGKLKNSTTFVMLINYTNQGNSRFKTNF